jgi:hypothetical protein
MVLLHQLTLGDVVGAALGTEDQKPIQAGPVINLPRVASTRVGHLGRAWDRAELGGDAAVKQFCVVEGHAGLLSFGCAANPRHDLFV